MHWNYRIFPPGRRTSRGEVVCLARCVAQVKFKESASRRRGVNKKKKKNVILLDPILWIIIGSLLLQ